MNKDVTRPICCRFHIHLWCTALYFGTQIIQRKQKITNKIGKNYHQRFFQNKSDTILLQPKMCNDVLWTEVDQNLDRLYDGVFMNLVVI